MLSLHQNEIEVDIYNLSLDYPEEWDTNDVLGRLSRIRDNHETRFDQIHIALNRSSLGHFRCCRSNLKDMNDNDSHRMHDDSNKRTNAPHFDSKIQDRDLQFLVRK